MNSKTGMSSSDSNRRFLGDTDDLWKLSTDRRGVTVNGATTNGYANSNSVLQQQEYEQLNDVVLSNKNQILQNQQDINLNGNQIHSMQSNVNSFSA
eukprot:UN29243